MRQNEENSPQRPCWMTIYSQVAHPLASACSKWGLGVEAWATWASPQGKDWGWKQWRHSEGTNVTQHRQDRHNPGNARETKDHSHRKSLTLPSNSACSWNKGPCPSKYQRGTSWLQSRAPEAEKQMRQRWKARSHYNLGLRYHIYRQVVSSHQSLSQSSWDPE